MTGGTYDPVTAAPVTQGWAVNRVGPCTKVDPTDEHATGALLAGFVATMQRAKVEAGYVGVWHDEEHGVVVIDVVDVYGQRGQAHAVAQERGQRYVGNLHDGSADRVAS